MKRASEMSMGLFLFLVVIGSGCFSAFIIWDYARFGWSSFLWALQYSSFMKWAAFHTVLLVGFWGSYLWMSLLEKHGHA
jgi:hypothetical protein